MNGNNIAKRMRVAETSLENQTGVKLKIVERSRVKIVDILHKSDPWIGKDCERQDCLQKPRTSLVNRRIKTATQGP